MVTYRTKFFTVFLILLSIVFQISSFPDYRAFIKEGYAPYLASIFRQLKMIDRAEGLIILRRTLSTEGLSKTVQDVSRMSRTFQSGCKLRAKLIQT